MYACNMHSDVVVVEVVVVVKVVVVVVVVVVVAAAVAVIFRSRLVSLSVDLYVQHSHN